MIAISVLLDAQKQYLDRSGIRRQVRCFFSENDPDRFQNLEKAVKPFHRPAEGFEIKTYFGDFEDAVREIQAFIGSSFPLIFIDPTGWTGYPFDKIKPLFARPKCEVLINFMYAFVHRFVHSEDEDTITSLNPILGGAGWRNRLDPRLDRGHAVETLFRETLKAIGGRGAVEANWNREEARYRRWDQTIARQCRGGSPHTGRQSTSAPGGLLGRRPLHI